VARAGWRDFFLTMTPAFREALIKTGYPATQILHQPLPVNTAHFYPREIAAAERERYVTDMVYISNVGNPELHLKKVALLFS